MPVSLQNRTMIEHPCFHYLDDTTSTNDDARDPRYGHGHLIHAERQRAGRGQRGHKWSSGEGLNLTFSVVFEPRFLPAAEQFLLSEAVALALVDTLARFGIEARIKWTNDIYVGDRKIVGMLLEHNLSGGVLSRTIAGIGLNVNQTEFDPVLPNPTSMRLLTGRTFARDEVLEVLYDRLMARYGALEQGGREELQNDYRAALYRLNSRQRFRNPATGELFDAVIRGVRPAGDLLLEHPDGTVRDYLFREVEFVLAR